jgi:ribosome-associated translation inhibitor RaiA
VDLNISFRHADPSPALIERVKERARVLARRFHHKRLRVVCDHDAGWADTQIVARVDGRDLVAHAEGNNLYDSVDHAFDKLEHQAMKKSRTRARVTQPARSVAIDVRRWREPNGGEQ